MFRDAYKLASDFTLPVVLSRKELSGKCSSAIGACIVINEEGWFATAHHIMEFFKKLHEEAAEVKEWEKSVKEIEENNLFNRKQKKGELKKLKKPSADKTVEHSAWFGLDSISVSEFIALPVVDLAIGKFQGFDPKSIKSYPIFKNPAKNFETGVSLCKLGFPFHHITPVWDEHNKKFLLPPGAVPLPRFPLEGMFTRGINVELSDGKKLPYPLKLLETSSPGLKGQSGGPTFDSRGRIWAIQSKTVNLPLGFNPVVPNSKTREHQFLNVGIGIHAETIINFLREHNINFSLSED